VRLSLALHGGADQAITHEDNFGFEQALRDAGKEYERIEFEGASHSFFDRKQEEFQEASDDAWRRTLDFIERKFLASGRCPAFWARRSPGHAVQTGRSATSVAMTAILCEA
jgi:hypothetical protein